MSALYIGAEGRILKRISDQLNSDALKHLNPSRSLKVWRSACFSISEIVLKMKDVPSALQAEWWRRWCMAQESRQLLEVIKDMLNVACKDGSLLPMASNDGVPHQTRLRQLPSGSFRDVGAAITRKAPHGEVPLPGFSSGAKAVITSKPHGEGQQALPSSGPSLTCNNPDGEAVSR